MTLRVLVIDDHTLFREGLQGLLASRDIHIAAAVGDAREGLRVAGETPCDVILLDLRMPDLDGLSLLDKLVAQDADTPVVMLTTSDDERDLAAAMARGARGYLLKDMEPDELVTALRDIVDGNTVIAADLLSAMARVAEGKVPQREAPFDSLTPRETEILGLLAEGQSNKVIARNLGISDGTVKLHVKAILRKLEVHSRVEAAVMAVEHGLRAKR